MKDFLDKYVSEIIIFITIAILGGLWKLVSYFFKSKINDRMDKFESALNEWSDKFDKLEEKVDNADSNSRINTHNIIMEISNIRDSIEDLKDILKESIIVQNKHSVDIAGIKATCNTVQNNKNKN